MAGSCFGKHFSVSTWGESHGKGLGVVIDGCPRDFLYVKQTFSDIWTGESRPVSVYHQQKGRGSGGDPIRCLRGKTTGTPISILVANTSQRSQDYSEIASYYRPGHADYTFDMKYGFRDYRGGGRSSAERPLVGWRQALWRRKY